MPYLSEKTLCYAVTQVAWKHEVSLWHKETLSLWRGNIMPIIFGTALQCNYTEI